MSDKKHDEREFIRSNGSPQSETYTVCRLEVPLHRFADELRLGMHRHFVNSPTECPAMTLGYYQQHAGPAASFEAWEKAGLRPGPRETLEVVHPSSRRNGGTLTICRIGVPRKTLIEELDANLHDHYHATRRKGSEFAQGNPSNEEDNVRHPKPECVFREMR